MTAPAQNSNCNSCGTELATVDLGGLCPSCVASLAFSPRLVVPKPRLPPGPSARIAGYELLGEIARGGMGVVFKARDLKLKREVAIKMIRSGQLAGPVELQRFRIETEAAARLQHPNIVGIYEVGECDGLPYFSMQYVQGQTLAQLVATGPLEPKRAAGYVKTIAQAVHYAHQEGILHRDLKSSNVLIDRFDQPRITDFGLAKRLASQVDDSRPEIGLTMTGQVLGTPAFIPPEQAVATHRDVGPQTDVYSLGAILYFLLTGRAPFSGRTLAEMLTRVLQSPPVSPRSLNAGVPRDLETICLKCLEKEAARRYTTAQELADDISRFLSKQPIRARPAGIAESMWRRFRRHPAVSILTFSFVGAIAALTGLLWHARVTLKQSGRDSGQAPASAGPSYTYTGPIPRLTAIDEDTLTQTAFGFGGHVAFDPKNNHLWCAILASSAVIVRDGLTGAIVTNLTLADCPGEAAFDPKSRVVWISAQCGVLTNNPKNYPSNDRVWVIDADNYEVIRNGIYSGGINGSPAIVNPATGRFYHENSSTPTHVQRIGLSSTATDCAFGTVRAVDPEANLLYAIAPTNVLQIIDGAPDPEKVLINARLPFPEGSTQLVVDPARNRLYAGCLEPDGILVLDAHTGQTLETIMLKKAAKDGRIIGMAIDSGKNRIFALTSNGEHSRLFAIQHDTQQILECPGGADGLVVNPSVNKVYIWRMK